MIAQVYLFLVSRVAFYRWRMKSRVRKLQRDFWAVKYGRRSRIYRNDNRRMSYGEHFVIIGKMMEKEFYRDGVLSRVVSVMILSS